MRMIHKEKGFEIQVTGRRGKPVPNKQGFVNIEKGQYKQCHSITIETLEEKFQIAQGA